MSCSTGSTGGCVVVWIRFFGKSRSWGRSKADATGAGSAADGTKPPVKPGLKCPFWGFWFSGTNCSGEASERRLWINQTRSCRAAFAGFLCGFGTVIRETPPAWRRSLAPPARLSAISSDRSSSSFAALARLDARPFREGPRGRHFGPLVTLRNAEIPISESHRKRAFAALLHAHYGAA
jgi:hypothetical protein